MSILSRYILRSFLVPFIFGLVVIIFLFLINFFIKYIPMLLSKDVSISVIVELVALNMAWIVGLSIPMAVLVATLMIFGKMSEDNEITAMKASGYGIHQAMLPVLIFALIIAYGNYHFNNNILPELNHKARRLFSDINLKKPSLSFQEGVFSDTELIKNRRLHFKEIDQSSNWVYGVTILDYSDKNIFRTLVAEKATLDYNEHTNQIVMDLYDVEVHEVGLNTLSEYRRSKFDKHRIRIDVESTELKRSSKGYRGDREKSIAMLRREIKLRDPQIEFNKKEILRRIRTRLDVSDFSPEIEAFLNNLTPGDFSEKSPDGFYINKFQDDPLIKEINKNQALVNTTKSNTVFIDSEKKYRNKLLVEIQKKYSIPAACIVFVLIGIPLGVRARHGGLIVGGGLSILFFLIYWTFLISGEQLSDRGLMTPWLAMWLANIVVGAAGIWLTVSMILETAFMDFSKWTK